MSGLDHLIKTVKDARIFRRNYNLEEKVIAALMHCLALRSISSKM